MASGHVNRTQRSNTWQHRPSLRREESPCQSGAVHTWHLADSGKSANVRFARWAQPVDATLYLRGKRWSETMEQRFRRGFTTAEKTEVWDTGQRGESLKGIGRAF